MKMCCQKLGLKNALYEVFAKDYTFGQLSKENVSEIDLEAFNDVSVGYLPVIYKEEGGWYTPAPQRPFMSPSELPKPPKTKHIKDFGKQK